MTRFDKLVTYLMDNDWTILEFANAFIHDDYVRDNFIIDLKDWVNGGDCSTNFPSDAIGDVT